MTKYQKIKKEALNVMCRRCINAEFDLNLRMEDCHYRPYPELCVHCGQARNIVAELRRGCRLRLYFIHSDREK